MLNESVRRQVQCIRHHEPISRSLDPRLGDSKAYGFSYEFLSTSRHVSGLLLPCYNSMCIDSMQRGSKSMTASYGLVLTYPIHRRPFTVYQGHCTVIYCGHIDDGASQGCHHPSIRSRRYLLVYSHSLFSSFSYGHLSYVV